jgi:hypothetical protein
VLLTVMLWVVAPPGLHTFPEALLLVSTTLPPAQKVVGPPALMVGVGKGLTVTVVPVLVALQPLLVTVTLNVPLLLTVMLWVVAPPGLHTLPEVLLLVSTTLPPAQKVVGPPALIVGVAGFGFTVTVVPVLVALQPLLVTVTL